MAGCRAAAGIRSLPPAPGRSEAARTAAPACAHQPCAPHPGVRATLVADRAPLPPRALPFGARGRSAGPAGTKGAAPPKRKEGPGAAGMPGPGSCRKPTAMRPVQRPGRPGAFRRRPSDRLRQDPRSRAEGTGAELPVAGRPLAGGRRAALGGTKLAAASGAGTGAVAGRPAAARLRHHDARGRGRAAGGGPGIGGCFSRCVRGSVPTDAFGATPRPGRVGERNSPGGLTRFNLPSAMATRLARDLTSDKESAPRPSHPRRRCLERAQTHGPSARSGSGSRDRAAGFAAVRPLRSVRQAAERKPPVPAFDALGALSGDPGPAGRERPRRREPASCRTGPRAAWAFRPGQGRQPARTLRSSGGWRTWP